MRRLFLLAALLASPLLIGCDMSSLDDFTLGFFSPVKVRDLWRQQDLGTVEDNTRWSVEVAPHGVRLLKLSK